MSFEIALSGINAINTSLDTISNNIANAGTYGYKSSRANFASIYAGDQPMGTEISSITQNIDKRGPVSNTGRAMDAMIQGRGFFTTRDHTGSIFYTRVGLFGVDKDGYVVDSFGNRVQGYAAVPGSTALGPMGDMQVPTGQIAAQASDRLQYVGNLSADWTAPAVAPFDPAEPQSFNSSVVSVVYDSRGSQHSVTQYFVRSSVNPNEVTVYYTFDGTIVESTPGSPVSHTLTFGTDGRLTAPAGPVSVSLGTPSGADPLAINIDYAGTTQFAGEATTSRNTANGYPAGVHTGIRIESDGAILAEYSNGQRQQIGTVALAIFPNEGALQPVSDTSWISTNASGNPLYFAPGSGIVGTLTVGVLEQSNVDIATELVDLMFAQRNYQANTKVIQTADKVIQSLMQAV
ncbi:MAG: flagellar hook-basal body complex protein [Gammaproteobacteria bacterium]